ncbi:MAG: hypothetical protein FJ297_01800 [Planctomycetes bacterium]|nr:hypothetical protein [Planctomycetota bacterium]
MGSRSSSGRRGTVAAYYWICALGVPLVVSGCAEPVPLADNATTGTPPSSAESPASDPSDTNPSQRSTFPPGDPSTAGMYDPARNAPPSGGGPPPSVFGGPGGAAPGATNAGGSPDSPSIPGAPVRDPFAESQGGTRAGSDPFAGAAPPVSSPPPSATERVKADVGVGAKGRSLDKYDKGVQRMIAQPAKSLFAARERITFNIALPHALQLFEALNGYAPRSHEEFMRDVVEANNIQLPELRPGHRYLYDPKTKELFVEMPATP